MHIRSVLILLLVSAVPFDLGDSNLRLDNKSWNTALFGPYDPNEMDSQPLQYLLLEEKDLGFVSKPLGDGNYEKILHEISTNYKEPNAIYELKFEANGFNGTETFVLIQEGAAKCGIPTSTRQLAPITTTKRPANAATGPQSTIQNGSTFSTSRVIPVLRDSVLDHVRYPPVRMLQDVGDSAAGTEDAASASTVNQALEITEAEATTDSSGFSRGLVDLMFIDGTQTKLTDAYFTAELPTVMPVQDHVFSIKGRFVHNCECYHSPMEDVPLKIGETKFEIKTLHVECPNPSGYKILPKNAESLEVKEEAIATTSPPNES